MLRRLTSRLSEASGWCGGCGGQGERLEGGPRVGRCTLPPRSRSGGSSALVVFSSLSVQSGDDLRVTAPVDLAKVSLPAP